MFEIAAVLVVVLLVIYSLVMIVLHATAAALMAGVGVGVFMGTFLVGAHLLLDGRRQSWKEAVKVIALTALLGFLATGFLPWWDVRFLP